MHQNSDLIGVFVKAVAFAADKHRTQRRKDVRGVHPELEAVFDGLLARHAELR